MVIKRAEFDFKQYMCAETYYGYHCHVLVFDAPDHHHSRIDIDLVLYDDVTEAKVKCAGIITKNRTSVEIVRVQGLVSTNEAKEVITPCKI